MGCRRHGVSRRVRRVGPDPAVAAARLAVRRSLAGLTAGRPGPGGLLGRRRLAGPGGGAGLRGAQARPARGRASPSTTGCSPARPRRPPGRHASWPARPRARSLGLRDAWPRPRHRPGPTRARRPPAAAGRYAALEAAAANAAGGGGPARPHPGRPGRDRAARPGPRLRGPLAGRDGAGAAAATCARCSACAGRRPAAACAALGLRAVGRPAELRPALRQGRVRQQAAAGAGGRARAGRRRGAGPDRRTSCGPTPTLLDALAAGRGGRLGGTLADGGQGRRAAPVDGPGRAAGRDQDRVLRRRRAGRGLPGGRADPAPRRRARRAGHRLARPALD